MKSLDSSDPFRAQDKPPAEVVDHADGYGIQVSASGFARQHTCDEKPAQSALRSSLVKINCAAIPSDLLESELFGHERGAFTGAISQKVGRFELADKGTIFLDEIGDIPRPLQPKLLRVLQEQEFERLGSARTQHVHVRVLAATHRDLERMVEQGESRSDLYYRLNVFPVVLPPLRARREDIPALVNYFVNLYSRQMGKRVEHIHEETMLALCSYAWPGNVRDCKTCFSAR
jgi:formate hydrogenlyase transcriptional activator